MGVEVVRPASKEVLLDIGTLEFNTIIDQAYVHTFACDALLPDASDVEIVRRIFLVDEMLLFGKDPLASDTLSPRVFENCISDKCERLFVGIVIPET